MTFRERWASSDREGCYSSWVCVCQDYRRGYIYRTLFKLDVQGERTEKTQAITNTHPTMLPPIISEDELKCVCLNVRSILNKSELDIMGVGFDHSIVGMTQ